MLRRSILQQELEVTSTEVHTLTLVSYLGSQSAEVSHGTVWLNPKLIILKY